MKNYIVFENGAKKFPCWVETSGNIVTLHFTDTVPAESTMRGFTWHHTDEAPASDYTDYVTVYRYDSDNDIYQLSNDGSVFVPTVTLTSNGGTLNGELMQNVSNYSDIVVPTPVDDENWEFKNWNPAIPTSGEIYANETYEAVFEYIGTPPVPEPTVEERLESAETDIVDTQTGLAEVYEIVLGGV